jgi:arylsulfatase A-like enzyme
LLALLAALCLLVPQGPPDVYVILADDMADTDLDAVDTPHLDALAAGGVRFRRAYTMPNCTPSRASLLLADEVGPGLASPCVAGSEVDFGPWTLPKAFDIVGYDTALFGKWHYGSNAAGPAELTPHLFGFNAWRAGTLGNLSGCGSNAYDDWKRVDDGDTNFTVQHATAAVRDAVTGYTTQAPLFALVSFHAPHAPYHYPPGQPIGSYGNRDQYEAMVRDLDAAVGAIVASLDLTEDWVIFVGDNGTPKDARRPGQLAGQVKHSVYEDGVRVPMIFAGPGLSPGESDALVHIADIGPTLAEALGLEQPWLGGVSFLEVVQDPSHTGYREYVYVDRAEMGPTNPRERAVITERYKLREWGAAQSLYDLEVDPAETVDLAGDPAYAGTLALLQGYLSNHL